LRWCRRFPGWGEDKLVVLLRRQFLRLSVSIVGRILWDWKRSGILVEPFRCGARRLLHPRPYAVKKLKDYWAFQRGDLVQVDTPKVRPLPGVIWKHIAARDDVSRWDFLQAHTRATAATTTQFLDSLQERMAFPIWAVHVDGGRKFAAEFEQGYQQRSRHLFVLPPRSPKMIGAVERALRSYTE
jgi:putative transposase